MAGYAYQQRIKPPRVLRDEPINKLGAWDRTDMRQALADRDVAMIYRLLQRYGVSQRRIAAETGQSQSEISEISEILGGRHVTSYDVLARIADGLTIPRGRMGLAYDPETIALFTPGTVIEVVEARDPELWEVFGGH